MKKLGLLMLLFLVNFSAEANSSKKSKNERGLLPEVKMTNNEEQNEKNALVSEMVITRAENKAIESLQNLINKKKGTPEEADLWFRLAELYMKRSKSGRFFDLHKNTPLLKLSPFPVPNESGAESLRRAAKIYFKIEKEFPKFQQMDSVLFNNAFAHQQLNLRNVSESLFRKLQAQHPQSPLIPDSLVALGELLYDQQKFSQALIEFLKLEKFPNSRVYSYGMYKAAWSYYNNQQTDEGVQKLLLVVRNNPPLKEGQALNNRHHLRREALRDLAIFVSDSIPSGDLYGFFKKITDGPELDESVRDVSRLYLSHSRHKDLNQFLADYLADNDESPGVVEAHLQLVEANEALKARDLVVKHLESASELCQPNSSYSKNLPPEQFTDVCTEKFRRHSLDLAGRWWDIWLKNKNHAEFSNLTEKAFNLILKNEDPKAPDFKTRFALAELKFQKNQYAEAAKNYKMAADQSTDKDLAHNALYGAVFSTQKYLDNEKIAESERSETQRKQLELTQEYLTKFPTGQHVEEVKLQKAILHYSLKQIEPATQLTQELLKSQSKKRERLEKAQDLWLEILNNKKDYVTLKKDAEKFQNGVTEERKEELTKISQQAHLAYIDGLADKGQKIKAAEELQVFSDQNQKSPLAKEAQWKSLALYYAEGAKLQGAQVAEEYARKYPDDPRSIEGLKEAAYVYSLVGQMKRAGDILNKVAQKQTKDKKIYLKQAADLYLLDKEFSSAQSIYLQLLEGADRKEQSDLYAKIYSLHKSSGLEKDVLKTEEQILAKGIEPLSTEIMITRAEKLYSQKNYKAAFDLSLKANGRDVPALTRAPARLLQAKILEDELMQQSVKARLDKLALVLSIKTEKLDKAHTAYLGAAKMTNDEIIKIRALEGIDRCYSHYVASLENLPMPAGLSSADQAALQQEIKTLLAPIKERKLENEGQMASLKKNKSNEKTIYANLLFNESVRPAVKYPTPDQFNSRVAEAVPGLKDTKNKDKDLSKKISSEEIGKLTPAQQALFYSSIAESQNKTEKALWLIEVRLKEVPENAELLYQRLRLVYKIDKKIELLFSDFDKLLRMNMSSPELKAFAGVRAFVSGDLDLAIKNFSSMTIQEVYTYSVSNLMSEAFAMKGQVEKALELAKDQNKSKYVNFESLLQEARVLETYKNDGKAAADTYQKALKMADTPEAKEWLQGKIEYLKNVNTVSSLVSPAGSY